MSDWIPCSKEPPRYGPYEVQCCFPDGEPLCEIQVMRWEGQWITGFGLEVMPHDKYREIGGGE